MDKLKILRIAFINALLGVSLLCYLLYSETGQAFTQIRLPLYQILLFVLVNALGWAVYGMSRLMDRFISWGKNVLLRFILGLFVNYTMVLFILFLIINAIARVQGLEIWPLIADQFLEATLQTLILSFFTIFIFLLVDFALYSYNQYSRAQIETIQQHRQLVELQYEALKSQLSPHFLFNNFNTLYSLINARHAETELYIRMLAQTYQYILQTLDHKLVELSKEIDFIRAYMYLQKIRFGDAIRLEIASNIPDSLVPPLSLQILLENAIKHNAFDDDHPLTIVISYSDRFLTVCNNLKESETKTDSLKIGLNNLRKRYEHFSEKHLIHKIENGLFKVKLPLIVENGQ